MKLTRRVSAARKRKLRKLGERVWWCVERESWVWCMGESRRPLARRKRPW